MNLRPRPLPLRRAQAAAVLLVCIGASSLAAADDTAKPATARPVPAPGSPGLKSKIPPLVGPEALKGAGKGIKGGPGPLVPPAVAPGAPGDPAGSAAMPPGTKGAIAPAGVPAGKDAAAGKDSAAGGGLVTDPGFGKDPDEISCKKGAAKVKIKPFFDKAAIEEVVKYISKMTCKSFIVSEKIKKGNISIYTGDDVTIDAFYAAFESALRVNGLAIEKVGVYYKIVESKELVAPLGKAGATGTTDHVITKLIPLKNVDGAEMMTILDKLKSLTGEIQLFPLANTIILTDVETAVKRLETIIDRLDAPGTGEELFLVRVEHAVASEIATLLVSIFDVSATGTGKPGVRPAPKKPKVGDVATAAPAPAPVPPTPSAATGGSAADVTLSKVIADDRTNQLILKTTKRNFDRILPLILKLDIDLRGTDARIHVRYLENAKAEELSATLASLTTGVRAAPGTPGAGAKGPAAAAGVPALPGTPGSATASLFDGSVKISPDPPTNALVVVASGKDYETLAGIIDALDIPRRQVLVEVVILEVSLDKLLELGFVFHGGAPVGTGDNASLILGATALGGLQSIILDPSALMGLAALLRGPTLEGTEGLIPSSTGGAVGIPAFGAFLRALQTDSDVNILSTPNILATDNVEAEITVGANIPVQAGFTLPSSATGVTGFTLPASIQRQDIGLTLKIKPQINESDYVSIDIDTEITALLSVDPVTGPTLSNRALKTTVIVPDQNTVVIGGLVEDRMTVTEDKVPILGDIPILGYLFKHSTSRKSKVNLIIFMTPYIIKDAKADFRKIFLEKLAERKAYLEAFGRGELGGIGDLVDYSRSVGGFGSIDRTIGSVEKHSAEEKAELERLDRKSLIGPAGMVPLGPMPGDVPDTAAPESAPGPGPAPVPESAPTKPTPSGIKSPDPGGGAT